MNSKYLKLESCMLLPDVPVTFLAERTVSAEFRNISTFTLEIVEMSCSFATEKNLDPIEYTKTMSVCLQPKHAKDIHIDVKFGLELRPYTNSYKISVKFKSHDEPEPKEETFDKSVIINIKRDPDPVVELFVSHKEPHDTHIAKQFEHYLKKIGFYAFIAEEDRLPGIPLWDKIYPAIDRCKAFVLLWTEHSTKSENIREEINHAIQMKKRIILIKEDGLDPPKNIPSDTEHIPVKQFNPLKIIEVIESINRTYASGYYELDS